MLKCSMIILIWIDYSYIFFLIFVSVVFWTTLIMSRSFYSMKKPREFVHNKWKILFIIDWPFWTNIEYSHRVSTLIFVEIIVWELVDTSQWRNIQIFWYAQARQFPPQQSENCNWNYLTFLNKIYSFMNDWVSFSVEILEQFQTAV